MKETTGVLLIVLCSVIVVLLIAMQITIATDKQEYCQEFGYKMEQMPTLKQINQDLTVRNRVCDANLSHCVWALNELKK